MRPIVRYALPVLFLASGACRASFAQEPPTSAADVVARVVKAADAFIASVSKSQRATLSYDFTDQAQQRRWSNLPVRMVPRGGLRWGDLDQAQRAAAMDLFRATLSPRGVQQIIDNMEGDEALRAGGPRARAMFGRDEYYLSILGKPSTTEPWMWQFGGHHLGLNATIVGSRITLAPSLTGGQPMDFVTGDGRKVRQLANEKAKAFQFIASLSGTQRKLAIRGSRFDDLRFGPGREDAAPKPDGIPGAKLNRSQRRRLMALIESRIGILNRVHAKAALERIERDLDQTWFSWQGPTTPGRAASYRIQGPTLLIEYSPQPLGGDPRQHVHAVYRDPTNDYGKRFLKRRSL